MSNSIVVVVDVFVEDAACNGAVVLQPKIFNVVEQLFSYSSIAVVIPQFDEANDGLE